MPSRVSLHILFADDDLVVVGTKSLGELQKALADIFTIYKKFESNYGIAYHFQKFEILSRSKLTVEFDGKQISSTQTGMYLGYKINLGSKHIVSDVHMVYQSNRMLAKLPAFTTLRAILTTQQALLVFTTYVIPAFFGVVYVGHLSKATINKTNTLLRKFYAVIWKTSPSCVNDVFVGIEVILMDRFKKFALRAWKQEVIDIYYHKTDMPVVDHPLKRWSGVNRFSTPDSILYLAHKCEGKIQEFWPHKLHQLVDLEEKVAQRQKFIAKKIQDRQKSSI